MAPSTVSDRAADLSSSAGISPRAAYRDSPAGIRDYSVRFIRPLMIGSTGNPVTTAVPADPVGFTFHGRAFSPVIPSVQSSTTAAAPPDQSMLAWTLSHGASRVAASSQLP
jgi:hypothetical protein